MDIACRMKLSVLDLPVSALMTDRPRLRAALERETRFGVGASFEHQREHTVMDEDWAVSPVTQRLKGKAWAQLGTSGSGNHFVEFGELTVMGEVLGLAPGTYLALLSHSGSRGTGGEVATYYSRLAQELHPELPKELAPLAWLDLASEAGAEYWAAMELMGRYAAANHALIHRHVRDALGAELRAELETHHNFAWREVHGGRSVVVHRKGATPAGAGVLGMIPGSMGTPGYVVRGRGEPSSLCSASHGAGRAMSRTRAKERFTWERARTFLAEHHVELLSAAPAAISARTSCASRSGSSGARSGGSSARASGTCSSCRASRRSKRPRSSASRCGTTSSTSTVPLTSSATCTAATRSWSSFSAGSATTSTHGGTPPAARPCSSGTSSTGARRSRRCCAS
jgi:tRNA-splicing ligase RtcB